MANNYINMIIKVAPSILSSDFGKLNEEIKTIEQSADLLHVDVMDGNFVPNLTFGAPIISKIKTKLSLDCHLMVDHPESYIESFVKAGADIITVHVEACTHLHRVVQQIKSYNIKAGVALNPHTAVESVKHIIEDIDMLLLMTVNPGFGGQKFINEVIPKIKTARANWDWIDIQVDGGINNITSKEAIDAGANILVAGSYVFKAKDRGKAIESLRN